MRSWRFAPTADCRSVRRSRLPQAAQVVARHWCRGPSSAPSAGRGKARGHGRATTELALAFSVRAPGVDLKRLALKAARALEPTRQGESKRPHKFALDWTSCEVFCGKQNSGNPVRRCGDAGSQPNRALHRAARRLPVPEPTCQIPRPGSRLNWHRSARGCRAWDSGPDTGTTDRRPRW